MQIETAAGVANVEEIAAVEGIDVIFVGPGDLAVSLGTSPGSAQHTAAVTRILNAAARCGVPTGIFCYSPAQVEKYFAEGVRLFLIGADVVFLAEAAGQTLKSARGAIAAAALVTAKGVN
jgi:4-hydroxy-2-oxoheptanedioate aldolase